MRKSDPSKKVIPTSIGLTQGDLDLIKDIFDHTSFLSYSEVVRAAIREFHKAERPKYIYDRSAKDREKREQVETEKNFESMTDLDYAKTFKPLILKSRTGKDYAVFLILGRSVKALPVENMKKWREQEPFIAITQGHLDDLEKFGPGEVLSRLRTQGYIGEFDREYDIDLQAYLDAHKDE